MTRYLIRFTLLGDPRCFAMPCEDTAAAISASSELARGGHHVERIFDLTAGIKMVAGHETNHGQ